MALHKGYVGAGACTSGPTTGARGLAAWYLAVYADDGGMNAGIFNCRPIRGGKNTSIHGEGRAFDAAVRPYSAEYGWELARELRRMSKEIGIQCIIWDRKIWSAGYKNTGWHNYNGSNPHVDHLHIELTWTAARRSQEDMIALLEKHIHIPGQTDVGDTTPVGEVKKNPPKTSPNKDAWPEAPLDVDGIKGKATVTAWQTILASKAAGGHYKGKIDGKWGAMTTYAMIEWMKELGFYKHTPNGVRLINDRVWGYWAKYEFQRLLKSKRLYSGLLDGRELSLTVKGGQKYCNSQAKYFKK